MICLSVLVPGIRNENWYNLYKSIKNQIDKIEVIFVGPYALPNYMEKLHDVKYIKDFGSPMRCTQIAFINACGKYVICASDDSYFIDNHLKTCMCLLEPLEKTAISCKYYEGDNPKNVYESDEYYKFNHHDSLRGPYFKDDWTILNSGLIKRQLLEDIGGWSTEFECTAMGYSDLAARLHFYGIDIKLYKHAVTQCTQDGPESKLHQPVVEAQLQHDQPLFKKKYGHVGCVNQVKIDINNWKNSDIIWKRRFS